MSRRGRNYVLMAVVGAFIVGILATTSKPIDPALAFVADKPLVIAHQGGNLLRPGNTFEAFEHALELGADVLEMDIQRSVDGVLVVIHDARVERTTEGSGAVSDMSLAQLQALDAGYHWPFDGDARPWRGKGLVIPVLEEILQRFAGVRMNIEIKTEHAAIATELCGLLSEHGALQSTLVASFHADAMLGFRSACPDALTSAYRNEVLRFFSHHVLGLTRLFHPDAHALQLSEQIWGIDLLRASTLASAHSRNMLVHAWTINDEPTMRRYIAMGLDGIITDDPGLLIQVLAAAEP